MNKYAVVCLLLAAMLILPLTMALPSAFEMDSSGRDLDELEDMLSGEHRGSAYSGSNVISRPPLAEQYDNPNTAVFRNDTFFGDFVRAFYGDSPTGSQSWAEMFLNGSSLLPANITSEKDIEAGRHLIKPVLIKEPEF